MFVLVGVNSLEKVNGGFGMLIGGVLGVELVKVVVIGGGVVGLYVIIMVLGFGVDVMVLDCNIYVFVNLL